MVLSVGQREIIYFIDLFFSILSIAGCIFMIVIYFSFEKIQGFAFKLILWLSIFDLFSSIGFAIPTYNSDSNDILCQSQGIILNFFTFCSILWSCFIAVSLYLMIVKSKLYLEKYFKYFILSVIIVSLIDTAMPIYFNSYGEVAGWCWIIQNSSVDKDFYLRYFLFFIPVWIVIFSNILLYISVFKRLRHPTFSEKNDKVRISLSKKLKFYPLILILCYLPYTVKGSIEVAFNMHGGDSDFYFTIVAGTFRCLNGLLNAIVYGFTKKVRKLLASKISGIPLSQTLRSTSLTKYHIIKPQPKNDSLSNLTEKDIVSSANSSPSLN